jgi:hypothetical protein
MSKMIELALEWHRECYQPVTLKYSAQHYSFKKNAKFREILEAAI